MAKRKHGAHGGAWKVAYADFVTAMMAFFLVLWIIGLSTSTKKAVSEYFKTRLTSASDLLYFNGFIPKMDPVPFNMPWPTVTGPNFIMKPRQRRDSKNIEALKSDLKKIMGFSTSIRLTIDENDIRIDLVDSQPAGLFGSVLERFTPLLQQMLGEIAAIVRDMPNRIVIEGHTNSVPYQGPAGESNWELSIERANMARMILEQQGVQNQQIIELRGCADQFLLDKIDPMSLTNRRISIVIKRRMPYYPEINGVFGQ